MTLEELLEALEALKTLGLAPHDVHLLAELLLLEYLAAAGESTVVDAYLTTLHSVGIYSQVGNGL